MCVLAGIALAIQNNGHTSYDSDIMLYRGVCAFWAGTLTSRRAVGLYARRARCCFWGCGSCEGGNRVRACSIRVYPSRSSQSDAFYVSFELIFAFSDAQVRRSRPISDTSSTKKPGLASKHNGR